MSACIDISTTNPFDWNYKGRDVLLLGGSCEDNLFQIPHLESHLNEIADAGGNFIRCTMSSRDPGDIWPFETVDRVYDLRIFSRTHWDKFEACCRICCERDIILQIELWDRFDFARDPWSRNPYNPKNNSNYEPEQIGLEIAYDDHPGTNKNPFFFSVPALNDNTGLLAFQQSQVDKMLDISLKYPNVLYCMDNETSGNPHWGAYWSRYVQNKAREAGVRVHTTEMWDNWEITKSPQHRETLDHPEIYSFIEVSQNNHVCGPRQYENLMLLRDYLGENKRPYNSVKIYGAPAKIHQSQRDAQESFWKIVFGGGASARFHRPATGLGLSDLAKTHIRSMRMLQNSFDNFFTANPQPHLIGGSDCEAYAFGNDRQIAVVMFGPGQVRFADNTLQGAFETRFLDIMQSRWRDSESTAVNDPQSVSNPGDDFHVALLSRK